MKKQILLACAILSSMATFAQTTLWDGENQELGTQGGLWGDGSPVVVANPDKSGINTSDKCISFVMNNGNKIVKIPFRDWIKPNLAGNRRISLMLKRSGNSNVQVELSDPTDGSAGYWAKVVSWYGDAGAWQKVVFDFSTNTSMNDFPGLMTLMASTDDVSADETVYIDNIVVEDVPMVNGTALKDIADGSLTGVLRLTGSWMKGDCNNTENGWVQVMYNDFETLATKVSGQVTSIDMRGTVLKDAYNAVGGVNPNILIYADQAFGEFNVVANGQTAQLNLNDGYAFNAPEGFTAANVALTRSLAAGNNTVCLPFATTAAEMGATQIATFGTTTTSVDVTTASFNVVETAAANTPFVTDGAAAAESPTFASKAVEATPASLGSTFIGVYVPQSAASLWGVNSNQFMLGDSKATINAFHAYLSLPSATKSVVFELGNATAIGSMSMAADALVDVYTVSGAQVRSGVAASEATAGLAKGIYVINNKKVVVR